MDKNFFEELKELCEKHEVFAGVYTRDAEGKSKEHRLYLITAEDTDENGHVLLMFETITYFMNLALKVAKNKLFVISELLKIMSSVIQDEGKSRKDEDDSSNRTD